jgi:uridine kinase
VKKIKYIVGITGGSGAGKTTLIDNLRAEFKGKVSTFSLDNYYLAKERQVTDKNGVINFDLPTALDTDKMETDFLHLLSGETIEQSLYRFNNPASKKETIRIEPSELLIVEGLFVMHYPFISEVLNYSVFLSVDPKIQLERRLQRDVKERNYSQDDIIYQWENHVIPSFDQFVLPYKSKADLIITNNNSFDENIHILTSVIRQNLD